MKTKTVVFDIDGVLADFLSGFYSIARGLDINVTFDANQPRSWDTYPGLKADEVTRIWAFIAKNPTFWAGLPVLCSMEEIVRIHHLVSNHRVYFATNRKTPNALRATHDFLHMHFCPGNVPPVDFNVIVTHRKGEFCKVVDAEYYIDDKSENVDCAIWMTDGKTKSYVRDHAYNRDQYAPHSSKAKRVLSVTEFLNEVNSNGTYTKLGV